MSKSIIDFDYFISNLNNSLSIFFHSDLSLSIAPQSFSA